MLKDPYRVVMKQTKLPISLLNEKAQVVNLNHTYSGIIVVLIRGCCKCIYVYIAIYITLPGSTVPGS